MKNRTKLYIVLSVFVLLIAALDQLVKALVVAYIPSEGSVPIIEGIIGLTNVQNHGAAFSVLAGSRWLFLAITAIYFVALPFLIKKKIISTTFELWCMAAVTGGALGNVIDRVLYGYVVDMFEFLFVDFAIFNVADSFITCGAIALLIYLVCTTCDKHKKEQGHEADRS